MQEVDLKGHTDDQKKIIHDIKVSAFLNIAACNIKVKAFQEAVQACDEVLKLEPSNIKALYRRARATALPINAGVPDLRKAMKDLTKVQELSSNSLEYVKKEMKRV